jgi:hypothetical protein
VANLIVGSHIVRVFKFLLRLYCAQMLLGLTIGFAVPWLRHWGFI